MADSRKQRDYYDWEQLAVRREGGSRRMDSEELQKAGGWFIAEQRAAAAGRMGPRRRGNLSAAAKTAAAKIEGFRAGRDRCRDGNTVGDGG